MDADYRLAVEFTDAHFPCGCRFQKVNGKWTRTANCLVPDCPIDIAMAIAIEETVSMMRKH